MDIFHWKNGTATEVEQKGKLIRVKDIGERVADGEHERFYSADELLDLTEDHDQLNAVLRRNAIKAFRAQSLAEREADREIEGE